MLSFLLSYLLLYKYAVLFFVVIFASFGAPLPATALLMAAGAFAAQGYFDIYYILLFGFFASILGDMTGYFVSLRYGQDILIRIGFRKIITSPKFTATKELFSRHSVSAIFFSRFLVTNLGPTVNILSGLTKISYRKFFFYDIVGEILYVLLFSSLGYMFGDQWEAISSISQDVTAMLFLGVILLVLFIIIWRAKHNGNEKKENI